MKYRLRDFAADRRVPDGTQASGANIGKKLLLKPVDDSYSDVGVVIVCLMEILLTIRPLNG